MTASVWKRIGDRHELAMPDTAIAHAFLIAICEWAARENGARQVMLPTGEVDGAELCKVVVALACARRERNE